MLNRQRLSYFGVYTAHLLTETHQCKMIFWTILVIYIQDIALEHSRFFHAYHHASPIAVNMSSP